MIINLVYTPGMVRYLSLFLLSIIESSSNELQFRLINNGCTKDEREVIYKIHKIFPMKTIFVDFQCCGNVSLHGTLLDTIFHEDYNDSDIDFLFMDSDIYAKGLYEHEIRQNSKSVDAYFSCLPIWVKHEYLIIQSDSKQIGGPNCFSSNNIPLGASYFAYYKNEVVKEIISKENISFRKYNLSDLDADNMHYLRKNELLKEEYDTAKLFNIMLHKHGKSTLLKDIYNLKHIGGLSINALSTTHKENNTDSKLSSHVNYGHFRMWMDNKKSTCDTVTKHLSNLIDGSRFLIDTTSISDDNLRFEVSHVLEDISGLYKEFGKTIRTIVR